jgi:hypothetical protein
VVEEAEVLQVVLEDLVAVDLVVVDLEVLGKIVYFLH